jgi:hypothetical protein
MSLHKSNKQFLALSLFLSGATALGFVSLYSSSLHETKASDISTTSTWDGSTKVNCSHKVTMGDKSFYLIENANQLASLRGNSSNSNNYLLINDIDLNSKDWSGISSVEFQNLNKFTYSGIFDGNGHKILNYKLPGKNTSGNHHDYTAASQIGRLYTYASEIGFIGDLSGTLKNLDFTGSSTTSCVSTTAHYWYNGSIVGLNRGTIRNISADSIKAESDAWGQYWSWDFATIVRDSGMGIICGRNQGTMNYTTTKNSSLYCYEIGNSGAHYEDTKYIINFRYGQNAGYNNTSSPNYSYASNYYYNNSETWSSGGCGVEPEIDSNTTAVTSATSFAVGGDSEASSSLIDNYCPFDASGDLYQNDTAKAIDYAARYLIGGCSDCTSAFTQQCINLYNTNSAYKNVFDNLKSDQTYESTTTSMSATAKLEAFASRYGLSMNGASSTLVLEGTTSSRQSVVLIALGGFAILLSGAYIYSRRGKKHN